jgi:putative ABC transport system permease protein
MDSLKADVRLALRMLARNRGFTVVAALTLALGVGANTTMFSIVNATLLRPLPFPDPDSLVTVWKARITDPQSLNIVSLPNFRDWQQRSSVFQHLALFDSAGRGYNLTAGAGEPEQVSGLRVTASFFEVLGVAPLLGRTFAEAEEEPGADRVVVLSHGLWKRRYGADPALIGRTTPIDGLPYTVVGVMPASFEFQFWSGPRQLWVPAGWTRGDKDRGSNSFICIGRRKPGVSLAQARGEMDSIGRVLEREHASANAGWTVAVVPMSEYGMAGLRQSLYAMLGVVGFVLLIACVNVANLMLARAASRQRELAIRCALGAGRMRIVRQLLTESLALALVGGVCGLLLAYWLTSLLPQFLPGNLRSVPLRPVARIGIDVSVLAFTFGVTCLTGILFGVFPALAALRGDLNAPLKERARGSTEGKGRLRYALVASEVALTLVVLAGAGLMITSVGRLLGVESGLDPRNVLVMQMSLPQEDLYNGPPGNPRFCRELEERAGSLPGVVSVSAIAHLPLSGGSASRGLGIEGQSDPGPGKRPGAGYSVACANVLRTLGIPLASGRDFQEGDTLGAPDVALVNESMARRFWPGQPAVGKRFRIGNVESGGPWLTVVGVFRDVRHWGLDRDVSSSFLRPYDQAAWPWMSIVARTASAPQPFGEPLKKALALIEPGRPVTGMRTMEAVIGGSVSGRRFPMLLLSAFAVVALLLAAVGIAGVVGYSVVQRTQEIGVRIALGAQTRDVLRMVLGSSLSWTVAGLAVGLVAAFALLRFLRTLLFGVAPTDPVVLGAVSLLLVGVAALASYVPARRAARVDPVVALRSE